MIVIFGVAIGLALLLWFINSTINHVVEKKITAAVVKGLEKTVVKYIEDYDKHVDSKIHTLYGLMILVRGMSDEEFKNTFSLNFNDTEYTYDVRDKKAVITYIKKAKELMEEKDD